jgi:hypothetical protein
MGKVKIFFIGVIIGSIFFAGVSVASTGVNVEFANFKYFFNGVEKETEVGKEGFIHNGTTYVPIRFVSESLGKEVKWNSSDKSIHIGEEFDKEKREAIYELINDEITYLNKGDYDYMLENLYVKDSSIYGTVEKNINYFVENNITIKVKIDYIEILSITDDEAIVITQYDSLQLPGNKKVKTKGISTLKLTDGKYRYYDYISIHLNR